jgi:choline kinase
MIEIRGKMIIETMIKSLVDCGIKEVTIVVGYKARLLQETILDKCSHTGLKVNFVRNEEYHQTNTMYSLHLARQHLMRGFLFLHADLIFPHEMLHDFLASSDNNAVLVDLNIPSDWNDAMKVISRNSLLSYMSKSITKNEADGTAIGMYRFDEVGAKHLFDAIDILVQDEVLSCWVSEPINMIAKMIPVQTYVTNQFQWCDIDNVTDLQRSYSLR